MFLGNIHIPKSRTDARTTFGSTQLESYWPMWNGYGTDFGVNPGSRVNTGVYPGGFIPGGSVIHFNGASNSYLNCGGITFRTKLSLMFWIRFNSLTVAEYASDHSHNIFGTLRPSSETNFRFIYWHDSGVLAFVFYYNGTWSSSSCSDTKIKAGRWYHIAATHDILAGAKAKYWVNGRRVGTTGGSNQSNWATPTTDMYIGYVPNPNPSGFQGEMAEAFLLNRMIDDKEVYAFYERAAGFAPRRAVWHIFPRVTVPYRNRIYQASQRGNLKEFFRG